MNQQKIFMLLRCTEKKHATSFCSKGTIKLNTPQFWINLEEKEGKGRGDLLEGTYCCHNIFDIDPLLLCKNLRKDPIAKTINNTVYLRSSETCNHLCFCMFAVSESLFPTQKTDKYGIFHSPSRIINQYFQDFSNNKIKDMVENLPDEDRPVVIMIFNPSQFFDRVRKYFTGIGIRPEELLISTVDYIPKNIPFIFEGPAPHELFLKDNSFSYQNELRIVLNSKNTDALELIERQNGIINIGCLEDIAEIQNYYFEDMYIEIEGNNILYKLPEPKYTEIQPLPQLPKDQYFLMLHQIKNGIMEFNNLAEEYTQLEIIRVSLKEFYGIDIDIGQYYITGLA